MDELDIQIRNNIMNNLINCRKEKGITQLELAEELGLKPTTVASWEQGKSLPNIQTLYRLSLYYKMIFEDMYKDENGKLPQLNEK